MKKLLSALLYKAGVCRFVAWLQRDKTVILCYHSVTREPRPDGESKLHLPLALFVSHLDYLRRRYNVVPLGEYLAARREGRRLPRYSAVLTFDDGRRNFLTLAARALSERGLPATAFIITGHMPEVSDPPRACEWTPADDHAFLSWPEVVALARKPGVEIGSHSHTHPDLTAVAHEEVEGELRASYEAVIERTGRVRPALAYPYGMSSSAVRELAAAAGYSCGLTVTPGGNDDGADLYGLRRIAVEGDDDVAAFAARVSGVTQLYSRARTLFAAFVRAGWLRSRGRVTDSSFSPEDEMSDLMRMEKSSSAGPVP